MSSTTSSLNIACRIYIPHFPKTKAGSTQTHLAIFVKPLRRYGEETITPISNYLFMYAAARYTQRLYHRNTQSLTLQIQK